MYKSSIKTEEIIQLYNQGLSQREVGERLGLSQCCVRERLLKARTKLRQRGEHDYLIGKEFDRLTVIGKSTVPNKGTGTLYDCVCSCDGKITQATPSQLKHKLKRSCGCLNNLIGNENRHWKGCGELSASKWCAITSRTKLGRECSITIEYAWSLFLKQNRKCALSGLDIYFGKSNKDETTASLDRIDSDFGYTEGNVQWIHKDIQNMKWDKKEDYFLFLCENIYKNKRKQNEETLLKH